MVRAGKLNADWSSLSSSRGTSVPRDLEKMKMRESRPDILNCRPIPQNITLALSQAAVKALHLIIISHSNQHTLPTTARAERAPPIPPPCLWSTSHTSARTCRTPPSRASASPQFLFRVCTYPSLSSSKSKVSSPPSPSADPHHQQNCCPQPTPKKPPHPRHKNLSSSKWKKSHSKIAHPGDYGWA